MENEQSADQRSADQRSADERSAVARAIFPDGSEPDPRFTLANERTFLAWIRTSLAFLAGGIALTAFDIPAIPGRWQELGAIAVVFVALMIAGGSVLRWIRVERAMRINQPLPVPLIVPVLAAASVIGAGVVLVGLVV